MFLRALAANALVGVSTLGPATAYGMVSANRAITQTCGIAFTLFLVDIVLVYLPTIFGATGMAWAWSGKAIECVVFAAIVLVRYRELLKWPRFLRSVATSLATTVIVSIPELLDTQHQPRRLSLHRLAYQATMPGLAEELFFRGLLLAVLDGGLGRPKRALGIDFGLGVVVTMLLFYGGHAVAFDASWKLSVDIASAPDFALFGLVLCWLRYRTQSVWPCALTHNMHNCFIVVRQAVAAGTHANR